MAAKFVWNSRRYHCLDLLRRRKRITLWLVVIVLASLYFVSLLGVFRLESELRRHIVSTNIRSTNSSDAGFSTSESDYRKRLSGFTNQRQQQQRQRQFDPNTNGGGKLLASNAEERKDAIRDREHLPSKQQQQQQQRTKGNVLLVEGENARRREKLHSRLGRIAHETHQPFGSDRAKNADLLLWELSDFVPPWMKEYFAWHREKRRTLTEDMWRRFQNNGTNATNANIDGGPKFLVVQCSERRVAPKTPSAPLSSCGSLSERLGLLPYWLRMAHETNRLLFIHWTVPTDLSKFLDPPMGGFDWRAPVWLKQMLQDEQQGVLINDESKVISDSSYLQSLDSESLLRIELKHSMDFEEKYNALRNHNESVANLSKTSSGEGISSYQEPAFHEVFHDVWIIFFVPSGPILKNIYSAFRDNDGMEAGHYASIDLTMMIKRSPLPSQQDRDDVDPVLIQKAKSILECSSRIRPGDPFWLVTDAINVTRSLHDSNATENKEEKPGVSVFARFKALSKWKTKQGILQHKELLSQELIDFDASSVPVHAPESFYDIFVNLYLMAMGRCILSYRPEITNNNGSTLSRLASLIGSDSDCYYQFSNATLDSSTAMGSPKCAEFFHTIPSHFVAEPVIFNAAKKPRIEHYFNSPMIRDGADDIIDLHRQTKKEKQKHGETKSLFLRKETKFPKWMEEYLAWHRNTKSQLTRSNWKASNYLILGCFESYKNCGGISDRLKPLPMLVWEAYQSQRILLIWWERPKPLEEWLIPPKHEDGGVDWTVPLFLKEEILRAQPRILTGRDGYTTTSWAQGKALRKGAIGKNAIVYHIQTPDAGEKHYFDEQASFVNPSSGSGSLSTSNSPKVGSSYQDVFHHLFRRFFTPSPRLARLLNSIMNKHNLVPGEYTAVHLRALYGNRNSRDLQETLELAVLGVNCASNLFPGAPVFFASDTSFAADSAEAYGKLHGLPIVSLNFERDIRAALNTPNDTAATLGSNPIHLDKDPDWKNRTASAYDSTFVDLYMLAQSRCVAFSNGGYGTFGSLLSYESECNMRYFKGKHKIKKCIWMNEKMERQKLELPNVSDVTLGGPTSG